MVTEDIRKELFRLQDKKYRDFQSKLIPTVEQDSVIGVRTPELRKFAKQIAKRGNILGPCIKFLLFYVRQHSFVTAPCIAAKRQIFL